MNICDSDCAGRRSFHREPPQAPPDHARRRWALEGSATRSRSSCSRKPTCTHEAGSTRAVGRQDVGLNALRTTDLVHATADATETAEERRATVHAPRAMHPGKPRMRASRSPWDSRGRWAQLLATTSLRHWERNQHGRLGKLAIASAIAWLAVLRSVLVEHRRMRAGVAGTVHQFRRWWRPGQRPRVRLAWRRSWKRNWRPVARSASMQDIWWWQWPRRR